MKFVSLSDTYQVSVEVYHDTYRNVDQERYTALLTMMYKIDNGLVAIDGQLSIILTPSETSSSRRSHENIHSVTYKTD